MKNSWVLIFLLCLVPAATAWGEYGEWTQTTFVPYDYNPTFLGVAAPTADTLFTVGVWSDNIATFEFIWRSTNAGDSMENIYSWTMSSDPAEICEMLHVTDARTSVAATSASFAMFGGSGVSQECIDRYGPSFEEQALCVMVCSLTLAPNIWYTDDGGDSFKRAEVPKPEVDGSSVQSIYMINESVGYAGGLGSYVIKTNDGGLTWHKLSLDVPDQWINRVFFIDEDTGWLASGEWDAKGRGDARGLDAAQEQLHRMMLSSNPVYRHEFLRSQDRSGGAKLQRGKVLRTTDGGQTWQVQMSSSTEGFDAVFFIDHDNGWVVGETNVALGEAKALYHTTDGGETWVDVTGTLPAEIEGMPSGWYPTGIKFHNPGFGFLYGIGAKYLSYSPVILYTYDGGASWNIDSSMFSLQGGQYDVAFVDNSRAFSVGVYLNLMRYDGPANSAPIADAGDDFSLEINAAGQLDGTGSSDPDGDGLFYSWTQVSGTEITLNDPTLATPSFVSGQTGTAVFSLVVNDGDADSEPDEVTVTIVPLADDDTADDDATDDDATDDDATDDDNDQGGADDDNDNGGNSDSSGCGC